MECLLKFAQETAFRDTKVWSREAPNSSRVFCIANFQALFRSVVLLYESPGVNQVDGLPPVPNTGAVAASCRSKWSATIDVFRKKVVRNKLLYE